MVEEINISKISVNKITFDETNPNILTKEQMKSLKLVMEKFGFLAPVILNKDLQVIDGEHRVRVYQELGKKTIPAYVIDINTINIKSHVLECHIPCRCFFYITDVIQFIEIYI